MLRKESADGNRREETCQGNDQEYGEGSMAKRKRVVEDKTKGMECGVL